MAGCLGRSPSTISREIKRNGGPARYRATDAETPTAHFLEHLDIAGAILRSKMVRYALATQVWGSIGISIWLTGSRCDLETPMSGCG